ncbi:uncharacterized protein LOC118504105 [Anopheles stephensi]|uniref:uncharacterized protein LOC118504105 n=1 Tax=Anopheles stephensi TaxID=30069 RepID=UPI001658B53D|nr:uncharacterized protein LOC118504105 [Anopheles stephensi]
MFTQNMNGSKSKLSKASDSLTAEKLQRIIKNVRNASNILSSSDDDGCHKKLDSAADSWYSDTAQLKISHRKLTAHEIDKLMKSFPTKPSITTSPPPASSTSSDSEQQQQVQQEATEPSTSDDPLLNAASAESEISFTTAHSTLELPADVEDNLAYSGESLLSFSDDDQPAYYAQSRSSFSVGTDTNRVPSVTLFRTIDLTAPGVYDESYGETSRSDVDRPIMQVKVRPLAASHSIRCSVQRVQQQQQSDDELPLIDFRQIERNTEASWRKHR